MIETDEPTSTGQDSELKFQPNSRVTRNEY